jgi:hypothetical protein
MCLCMDDISAFPHLDSMVGLVLLDSLEYATHGTVS